MKQAKNIIGIIVSVILIVLLLNPQWLPVSAQTAATMGELKLEHFLIQRSGAITTAHLLTLLLAVAVVWLVYTIIRLILAAVGRRSDHAATVTTLVAGSLKYLAVIVASVWGLSILGVNTTAVLAGIGIIGLILGFGAQSLIEDIITGLFVIFERQYEIGDIIILDDFRGTVRSRANSIAACEVSVAYDTDIPRMEAILAEAFPKMFADHRDIYLAPPRYLGVDELGDSGIKLKIIVDCAESKVFAAKRQLNRDVRILFSETGIEIPFPQVVVHKG